MPEYWLTGVVNIVASGAIGSVGETIGGPLSSDGMIGSKFTDKGAIGGTIQEKLAEKKA